MKLKRFLSAVSVGILCMSLFTGFTSEAKTGEKSILSTDIASLSVPSNVKIVGLGEASHGVSEYQKMKLEVFKALVKNNKCRTFIIEGDFGGSLKVDEYINGGEGTAREAVREIGFSIYCTKEMVDLIEWMKTYNQSVEADKKLHFYGMDMQRFDNNKEYLFKILDKGASELSNKYKGNLAVLSDENMYSIKKEAAIKANEDITKLISEIDTNRSKIISEVGQTEFEFARECANSIKENIELRRFSSQYSNLRDRNMANKVDWFVEHGDKSLLFINGHNGHIGKFSASGYKCLGEYLSEKYKDAYFTIGTDADITEFNSEGKDGYTVVKVQNSNDLTEQLNDMNSNFYYFDFAKAKNDKVLNQIIQKPQTMSCLNVGLEAWQKSMKMFYTQTIAPEKNYDAMIVFKQVKPTTSYFL